MGKRYLVSGIWGQLLWYSDNRQHWNLAGFLANRNNLDCNWLCMVVFALHFYLIHLLFSIHNFHNFRTFYSTTYYFGYWRGLVDRLQAKLYCWIFRLLHIVGVAAAQRSNINHWVRGGPASPLLFTCEPFHRTSTTVLLRSSCLQKPAWIQNISSKELKEPMYTTHHMS